MERAIRAKVEGHAGASRRLSVPDARGTTFQCTLADLTTDAVTGLKWIALTNRSLRSAPHVQGMVIVNDTLTGAPRAILDAAWIVAARTAGETVLAAKRLARHDSSSLGFVACGSQARAHLAALRAAFPIAVVYAYAPSRSTAAQFVKYAAGLGLEAHAVDDPRDAVEGSNIVVTSVPFASKPAAKFDAAWLSPGSFIAFLDFASHWHCPAGAFDRVAVDDAELFGALVREGRIAYDGPWHQELIRFVGQDGPDFSSPSERSAFFQCGLAFGDLALAADIVRRATLTGLGKQLSFA